MNDVKLPDETEIDFEEAVLKEMGAPLRLSRRAFRSVRWNVLSAVVFVLVGVGGAAAGLGMTFLGRPAADAAARNQKPILAVLEAPETTKTFQEKYGEAFSRMVFSIPTPPEAPPKKEEAKIVPFMDLIRQVQLKGVLWDTLPVAYIAFPSNGAAQAVRKGDLINGMKVIDIQSNGVQLEYNGEIQLLPF
jgi:hypothetical protein